jgi:hypothetical protein
MPLVAGDPDTDTGLQCNLLKLRAVLLLLGATYGSKLMTARAVADELRSRRLKASERSVYSWRNRYLRFGFAGIVRQRRSDAGCPLKFRDETITGIVEAAVRVKFHGDMAREFRRLRAGISYGNFRLWVRRIQKQLRVIELPERGE